MRRQETIFKLAELAQLYKSRIEQLKVKVDTRINTTRLRERILAEFPDMQSYKKGRDVLMAFEEDVGAALAKAYEQDSDKDAVHIARAAQIVRRQIFGEAKPFNGFPERCHEDSVSPLLLTLMNMVLEQAHASSIKDQMAEETSPAALAIAQLLKFNSVKHKRTAGTAAFVRHRTSQETPVPLYIGLMLHGDTSSFTHRTDAAWRHQFLYT